VGDVTATADKVVNTVAFIDKDGTLNQGALEPLAKGASTLEPRQGITAGDVSFDLPAGYYPDGYTVKTPNFLKLTQDGDITATDVVAGKKGYADGGLVTGAAAADGGLASFPRNQVNGDDENTIVELTKQLTSTGAIDKEDAMFYLKRTIYNPDYNIARPGRFYVDNYNITAPGESDYENARMITNIRIENLKASNIKEGVTIAGLTGAFKAAKFNPTGTVLEIT
jgi:hypothetical protein